VVALAAAAPAAAALLPTSEPQPIAGCVGARPSLAALPAGGFLAIWANEEGVFLRRLGADGRPEPGPPREVAGAGATGARVETFPDGGYAVGWFDPDLEQVVVRRSNLGGELGVAVEVGGAKPDQGTGFNGLALAALAAGRMAVVWADGPALVMRELAADGTADGEVDIIAEYFLLPRPWFVDPAVARMADGTLRIYAVVGGFSGGLFSRYGELRGFRVVPAPGDSPPHVVGLSGPWPERAREPKVAPSLDGQGYLLAWGGFVPEGPIPPLSGTPPDAVVLATVFDAADQRVGPLTFLSESGTTPEVGGTAAVATVDGNWAVAWHASDPAALAGVSRALVRVVDPQGSVRGEPQPLAVEGSFGSQWPHLAAGAGGALLSAWHDQDNPAANPPVCSAGDLLVRTLRVGCEPGKLCLRGGRFELSLTTSDPRVTPRSAEAYQLTTDTGYFWFFAADNVEVVAKVLDGRAVNGHYWVFFGGLTDLAFELTVRDTFTGRSRTFTNPSGEMASRAVTDALPAEATVSAFEGAEVRAFASSALVRDAFPTDAADREEGSAVDPAPAAPVGRIEPLSPPLPSPCGHPLTPGLCLNGERFDVMAHWRDFDGNTGTAQGVELGDDSGYFWFFDEANVEVIVKVLDGRGVNGKFWVFYGALSNVEYHLSVIPSGDWFGASYSNTAGELASVADVEALEPPGAWCTCPAIVAPVCGRDGVTYDSECEAYCFGWVDVAHHGACTPP
jgi:hypothetical protein